MRSKVKSMMTMKPWLILWSAGGLVGGVPFAHAGPAERPSLVGRWQLNHSLSDDAGAKLREVMGRNDTIENDEPRTPGARRGGRRGGGAAGGGRDGSALASGEEAITLSEFVTAPERLEISEAAGEIALGGATAVVARLDPSGKWIRGQDGRQVRAEWKRSALVTEVRCTSGPTTKTTYRLRADKRQLEVSSRLDLAPGGSVVVRRVYDAVNREEPPL
jgi:hypothetical protein